MGGRGPSSPDGPNGPLRGSEPANIGTPIVQIWAPEAPRESQRLRRRPLRSGAPISADSEPRRG
eukprot:5741624-Alexandrium_andersonii.AAC.1